MRIQFYNAKPWEKEYIEAKLKETGLNLETEYLNDHLDKDHLPPNREVEIISVFIGSVINKEVLDQLPSLKYIATRSTGYDHIDVNYAKTKNILVSNVPSYGENTVAEFAFGLILNLTRKIFQGCDQVKKTGSFSVESLQGFDLKGKTLGVVGTGRIGKHVIRMAKGFEMKVIAYDPFPNREFQKTFEYEYFPLEEVLKQSDIVTLHVPYMKETHHLINAQTIQLMKKGAYLINTARGPIVETEALVKALKNGYLGGAGLDVLEEEGIIGEEVELILNGHPEEHNLKTVLANHALFDMPNVLVTPHNAFNTREALEKILITTIENIKGFLANNQKNLVK